MASYLSTLLSRARRKRVIADLMSFDDRMLRDIGITRSELGEMRSNRRVSFPTHE